MILWFCEKTQFLFWPRWVVQLENSCWSTWTENHGVGFWFPGVSPSSLLCLQRGQDRCGLNSASGCQVAFQGLFFPLSSVLQAAGTDTLCSVSSLGSILVFRSNLHTSSNKTSSNLLITFHLLGFWGFSFFFFLFQKQDAQCWNSLTFHVGPLWDVTQGHCDSLSFSPSLSPCEILHSPRPAPDPHTAEKQLIAGGLQWLGAAGPCCMGRIRHYTPSRGCALPYLFLWSRRP